MKTSNYETGIFDHHKMISTIMKLHFTRESPKTKYYRDYRKFDIDYFSSELSRQLNSVFCSIKENVDNEELNDFSRFHRVFLNLLNNLLNTSLERGCFPNQLNLAEVTPVFKKEDELNKENYRPVSVLSQASKIFERIVFNQMNLFFESKFSPQLTGFRKNHST